MLYALSGSILSINKSTSTFLQFLLYSSFYVGAYYLTSFIAILSK